MTWRTRVRLGKSVAAGPPPTVVPTYPQAVALSFPDVWYRFTQPAVIPPPPGPWTFDDSSGNGRSGTWNGGSSTAPVYVPGLAPYESDTALSFGGGLDTPAGAWMDSNAFTYEVLLYPTSANKSIGGRYVGTGSGTVWYLQLNTNLSVTAAVRNSAGALTTGTTPAGVVPLNTMSHFVFVVGGGSMAIWVNGVKVWSAAAPAAVKATPTMQLRHGGIIGGTVPAFAGTQDEMAYYATRALPDAEVIQHYTALVTAPAPPPPPPVDPVVLVTDQPAESPFTPDPLTAADLPRLVGVRMTDALEDALGVWPPKKARETATIVLVCATAAEAAAMVTQGTDVDLRFYADAATPVGSPTFQFVGRASDPEIAPHPLGVVVTVVVSDYRVDLDAETVGGVAYPAEAADARLQRMFTEAGMATSPGLTSPRTWPALAARPAEPVSLLEEVSRILSFVVASDPTGYHLQELVPQLGADGGLYTTPYRADPIPDVPVSPAPLRINPATGAVTADPDDLVTRPYVVDANRVAFGGTWTRRRGDQVDTVDVVLADQSVVRVTTHVNGQARSTYRLETSLTDLADGARTGEHLLPARYDTADPSGWQAETFTVYLNETPVGWFPRPLREVMAVADLQARHNPDGTTWWAGVVAARELVVAEGVATVALTLAAVGSAAGANSVTIDALTVPIDSLTHTIDTLAHTRL